MNQIVRAWRKRRNYGNNQMIQEASKKVMRLRQKSCLLSLKRIAILIVGVSSKVLVLVRAFDSCGEELPLVVEGEAALCWFGTKIEGQTRQKIWPAEGLPKGSSATFYYYFILMSSPPPPKTSRRHAGLPTRRSDRVGAVEDLECCVCNDSIPQGVDHVKMSPCDHDDWPRMCLWGHTFYYALDI